MTNQPPSSTSTHGDDETLGVGQAGRRRLLAMVLVAALLGAGLWLLIGQGTISAHVVDAFRRADPWWLGLALLGAAATYIGYALLYQAVVQVESGPRPPLGVALRLTIAVFGTSVIATAAGRLGGEYWSLRRMRESPPLAWSRVLALNTAAWAVLAAATALAALALLAGAGSASVAVELAWVIVVPACVAPAVYLSSPRRRRLAEDRGGRIRRTAAAVVRALALLRTLGSDRPVRARGLTGALVYWFGELLVTWAALRAFGITLGPAALIVGYATGYVSTMLPLPVGGVGGVDAATTYALTLVGVPVGPALLAAVVQRLFSYWLPLAVAITSGHFIRHLGRDLAAVTRPAAART
jgi:uncharacterized membrane protein YbhN (UPF0104 family)